MLGIQPDGRQIGEGRRDQVLVVPDFDREHAAGVEMFSRLGQDAAHHVQTVGAGGQCQRRFVTVFGGQGVHGFGGDIGRVAENEVVAFALDGGEQVRLDRLHTSFEFVIGDVAPGYRQGVGGDVNCIDGGIGKGMGHQNRQAARAGAQVERCADGLRIFDPRGETAFEQFGEVGTRHDDALIDKEPEWPEPGFLHQIGGGQALYHALPKVVQQGQAFGLGQVRVEPWLQGVPRQVQTGEDQPDGLVPGVVRTVTVTQPGFIEAADGPAQPVADGDQFVGGAINQLDISRSKVCS